MCHDSFIYVPWLIHMCAMDPVTVRRIHGRRIGKELFTTAKVFGLQSLISLVRRCSVGATYTATHCNAHCNTLQHTLRNPLISGGRRCALELRTNPKIWGSGLIVVIRLEITTTTRRRSWIHIYYIRIYTLMCVTPLENRSIYLPTISSCVWPGFIFVIYMNPQSLYVCDETW